MKNTIIRNVLLFHDNLIMKIKKYFRDNYLILIILFIVAVLTYGYEMFNLNLTIDEETAAFQTAVPTWNIELGRWANYILKNIFFPFAVIPLVPLFATLTFHISALLIIFESLEVKGNVNRVLAGAMGVAWPGMVFIYSFSTTNFVIGFGLFCISLSLLIFVKGNGAMKYWSVLPAAFAIGIYQTMVFALLSVFLLYFIYSWDKDDFKPWKEIKSISIVLIVSFCLYYGIHRGLLFSLRIAESSYISSKFDFYFLLSNWEEIIRKVWSICYRVYLGDDSIYGIEIRMFAFLLLMLGASILIDVVLSKKVNIFHKIFSFSLTAAFIFLPFIGGMFTKGYIPIRSMVGMPVILSGLMLLGLKYRVDFVKSIFTLLTLACLFQFVSSSNHLFASSQMAMEEDRVLGTLLIERMEEEKSETNSVDLKYFEMIGFPRRLSYPLVSRIETSGASFFMWDLGNSERVVLFLQTLGYYGLEPLPLHLRAQVVEITANMPDWPDRDSVAISGDIIIVKFGKYSKNQIESICSLAENEAKLPGFCP